MAEENIKRVLALFDDEDIPYIKHPYVQQIVEKEKEQVKKLGGINDRQRK